MRIALACLVVAACSHPATPPTKVPSQKIMRAPVSSMPTCADMGPLLRGPIDDEQVEGPKKEALIVATCERDHWPPAVLACAAGATEPTVFECLEQLPTESHARYDKALEKYARAGGEHDPPPVDAPTTCDDAFAATAVDVWPTAVTEEAERALAITLRGGALRSLCDNQNWPVEVKTCITDTPASGVTSCLEKLGNTQLADVQKAIFLADHLRAGIVRARANATNVTCEKAVAAHYSNAKWTSKAPELKGAERTKTIAAAKKAMLASCKSWSIEARACIVANDVDECYPLAGTTGGFWGYPPKLLSSNLPLSGIAECDDYAVAIEEMQIACPSLPQETKDAISEAYRQAAAGWEGLPAEARETAKTGCRMAAEATRQAAAACT